MRLLVVRERERRAFRAGTYWDLVAELSHQKQNFKAELVAVDGKKVATGRDFDVSTGKLAEGKFTHGGTRLMAWCVGNARIEPRANSVLITKQASGTGKIDPLMATLNATELLSRNPQPQRSFWESAA